MVHNDILNLTEKYKDDIVLLDGLLQWALNPTSMKAGYGINENYPYIQNNLEITFELSHKEVQDKVTILKRECDKLIKNYMMTYDLRKFIIKIITEKYFYHFKRSFLEKIKEASPETMKFLYLCKEYTLESWENLNVQYNALYGENL